MRTIIILACWALALPAAAQESDVIVLQCQNEQSAALVRIAVDDLRIMSGADNWGENLCLGESASCTLEGAEFRYSDGAVTQVYDWEAGRWQFLTEGDGAIGVCTRAEDTLP